jgi:hypothetical protein
MVDPRRGRDGIHFIPSVDEGWVKGITAAALEAAQGS